MGGIKRRKAEKRLKARTSVWDQHGKNPNAPNNPSNDRGQSHDMHRPGSNAK